MKKYCSDCKNHTIWGNMHGNGFHVCKLIIEKNSIGDNTVPHKKTCENKNEDFNCTDFKPKFLKRRKYK